MKYSRKIEKAIQSASKKYLEHVKSGQKETLNILNSIHDIYGEVFPNNDWSNINDKWEEKWGDSTFINLLNNKTTKDPFLISQINALKSILFPGEIEGDFLGDEPYELLSIPLSIDNSESKIRYEESVNYSKKYTHLMNSIKRIHNDPLSPDEAKIINSIKKNNFNTYFKLYENNIIDRSKYPYNLGKINNYLIEYCQNNNINIIFIGTGNNTINALGRYQRFSIHPKTKNRKNYRLEQVENLGFKFINAKKDMYDIFFGGEKTPDYFEKIKERNNYFNQMFYFLEDTERPLDYKVRQKTFPINSFESHLYGPFKNSYFDYINKLWGDLPQYKNSNIDPIKQYYLDEFDVGRLIPNYGDDDTIIDVDSARFDFEVYDKDLWLNKIPYDDKAREFTEIQPTYTKQSFLKEHQKLNKDNLKWIELSAEVLLPITYTCNIEYEGAEFDLTNLDILFKNKILKKSKTLLIIENNGFKNDDFINKTSSFPNRIIFDTGDIGINQKVKINWDYPNKLIEKSIPLTKFAMPLYNYFLPILKVLLELSPFTENIDINSAYLNNKMIKNIVATQLINLNSEHFDPNPVDINSIQNFERNFNSAVYILRLSGYIEKKGNLVITIGAIKKIRRFLNDPDGNPIIIRHSNKRTKYIIGNYGYWSTSEEIVQPNQIKQYKKLSDNDQTITSFIKSFSDLNKLITLPGENKKGNINSEYTNFSLAILRANNEE